MSAQEHGRFGDGRQNANTNYRVQIGDRSWRHKTSVREEIRQKFGVMGDREY